MKAPIVKSQLSGLLLVLAALAALALYRAW
jgi:hypothetical protein